MTGVLPIRRSSSQSSLNTFEKYTLLRSGRLVPVFGFIENKVRGLPLKYGVDFFAIKSWYDIYHLGGMEICNLRSVIEALSEYVDYGQDALKGETMRGLAGNEVKLDPHMFGTGLTKVDSKDVWSIPRHP